jgi:hypothetical protein
MPSIDHLVDVRTYFAAHAPDNIPEWFQSIESQSQSAREHVQSRYFAWRWYYADEMLKKYNQGIGGEGGNFTETGSIPSTNSSRLRIALMDAQPLPPLRPQGQATEVP